MLKGVNRQVVEIPQPECEYFERVLFFVKPEYYAKSETRLREQAAEVLKKTVRPPKNQSGRFALRLAGVLRTALAAGLGAGGALLLQTLLR